MTILSRLRSRTKDDPVTNAPCQSMALDGDMKHACTRLDGHDGEHACICNQRWGDDEQ